MSSHERLLANWEQQARLWHEQSMQFGRIMRRIEKHLLISQHGGLVSVDSLDSDIEEKDEKGMMTAQVETLSYSAPGPTTKRPYPSRPYAAGLQAVRRCSDDWSPPWKVFPLKAFRGSSYTFLKIQANWDDADLLRELSNSIADCMAQMVLSQKRPVHHHGLRRPHLCLPPLGRTSWREPVQEHASPVLPPPPRADEGPPRVHAGPHRTYIAVAILLPVVASLILEVVYSILEKDVSSAFTAAGYMTSAYSVCLVLLGVLNFVEF